MTKIPVSLKDAPIVDCVLEMRFNPSSGSVSDVLPGLLYSQFKDKYPNTAQTPEAQLPRAIRANDVNLKSRAIVSFNGPDGSIGVGDAGVQLIYKRPYPGWAVVNPCALALFGQTLDTGLIQSVERLSIAYSNIITTGRDAFDLSPLELDFKIGRDLEPRGPGTALRAEFSHATGVTVVQIQGGAKAAIMHPKQAPEEMHGLLLTVDTISFGDIKDERRLDETLNEIHDLEKSIFYSIITEETRDKLGPVWG